MADTYTSGSIPKQMAQLAAPLIAGNIFQQLYNTADAFILGRCAGSDEFAAAGIAGSVMNLFIFAIVGACTGMSVLFAQFYGGGDGAAFRRERFLSLSFGLADAVLLGFFGLVFLPTLSDIIQIPHELRGLVRTYLTVIFLSLPAAFLYNLYSAILRSVGHAGAALAALAAAVVMNVLLDVLLIAHFGMDIGGAAAATAASQAASAAMCIIYLRKKLPELSPRRADCRMDKALLRKTLKLSAVTALHQSGLYIGKLLVQGAVNTGGTAMISAYTASIRIEGFANSFGDSVAAASSVLTAQNFGAGKKGRVKKCFRTGQTYALALGALSAIIMYFSAGTAAGFMLGEYSGAAYENAAEYLQTIALFYVLCFTGSAFVGYFDGTGRVAVPFAGALGHITLRVILSWLFIDRFGLRTVAFATGVGWLLANIFWAIEYAIYQNRRAG